MRLEKTERVIIVSLVSILILGFAVSAHLKYRPFSKVVMESFDADDFKYKPSPPASSPAAEKININEAGAEDLMKLNGVGKTIAGAILEYRYHKGNFASIDDIKNVKGVGVALFEKIKDKITVE